MCSVQIYIISLPSAAERRDHIQQQFANSRHSFEFFDAVDGRQAAHPLFNRYNEAKRLRCKGYGMTPGELGCFASHYLLWEKCVQVDEPIVVIEDDAQLEPWFDDSFDDLAAFTPYGYLRLFVNGRYRPFTVIDTSQRHKVVHYHRGPGATRAYFITPSAASKFIASAHEWILAVDDYMDQFWNNNVPCRGLMPGVVKNETDFVSSVGKGEKVSKINRLTREIYNFRCALSRKWYLFRHPPSKG